MNPIYINLSISREKYFKFSQIIYILLLVKLLLSINIVNILKKEIFDEELYKKKN